MKPEIICVHCGNDAQDMIEILYKVYVNEWYNCFIYCSVCGKTCIVGPFKDED